MDCKYGAQLEEMLRDRLVCGVNHQGIQRKLLAESDLTYSSALKLAKTVEASERDAQKLGAGAVNQKVSQPQPDLPNNFTTSTTGGANRPKISCYRCGGPHLAPKCKHTDVICHYCKKKGHFARVCRSKSTPAIQKDSEKKKTLKRTNYVADTEVSDDVEYAMFTLSDKAHEPYLLTVTLNNVPVQMEVDTGAAVSIINESTYKNIQDRSFVSPLQPSKSKLRTYTGHHIKVLGITSIKARYEKQELCLSVFVVQGSGPNLMGRDWISQLEVNLKEVRLVEPCPLQKVLDLSLIHI